MDKKHCTTVMIGSLAAFEEDFGHLWGHGKNKDELTDSEKHYRKVWKNCRNNILTYGNRIMRKKNED